MYALSHKYRDKELEIPSEKTCDDCVYFNRCKLLLNITGSERVCDWIPIRFKENGD